MDMKTMKNTFGVTFYLRRYKVYLDGTMPVYARITVNGKRLDISLKRTVADKNWDAGKGMPKGSREKIVKLSNYLERFRSSIVECYQELHLQKKPITLDTIRENVFGKDQEDYTLCKLIAYHNKGEAGILAEGTLKNNYTTERYVHKFLKAQYKATDRYLSELSYNFIMQFERYLRTVKPAKG